MIVLINPPKWTTSMPPVAIPTLMGALKAEKIPSKVIDLNINFYDYLLTPEYLTKCIKCIQSEPNEMTEEITLKQPIYQESILCNIDKAKKC